MSYKLIKIIYAGKNNSEIRKNMLCDNGVWKKN